MQTRKLWLCIAVLVALMFACRALSGSAPTATPIPPTETHTPMPPPTATDTAQPPTATPTEETPPTPTEETSVAPVIDSYDLQKEDVDDGVIVYQRFHFHDEDGDVNRIDYRVLSASVDGLDVEGGRVDISANAQKSGDTITGEWDCGSDNYEVTLEAFLRDAAGNRSEPVEYTIVCGRGASVAGDFPDTFDDNRNSWGLDQQIKIENGRLQFRNVPDNQARWTWCDACLVSEEKSQVSVEASWSNSPNSNLGLLIDSGTCNPDGLVFLIGPHGYYTIVQSVRDEQGEWSHWRPFMEWNKSSRIRTAQNAVNIISAQYEFTDELRVSLFIGDTFITRVRVYGYNGSGECSPGLYAGGPLEANFDNFNISAP